MSSARKKWNALICPETVALRNLHDVIDYDKCSNTKAMRSARRATQIPIEGLGCDTMAENSSTWAGQLRDVLMAKR